MKKWLARIIVVSLLVMPALALYGCGGNGESASPQEPAAQEPVASQEGGFQGRSARSISGMMKIKERALKKAEECRSFDPGKKKEAELIEEVTQDFEDANKFYKKADYEHAQKGYENVLEVYPLHYGANVNLTLALLQQENNEEALVQALCSLALFPTDDGIPLNLQTAAVACGFSADDALEVGAEVVGEFKNDAEVSDKLKNDLSYNSLWDRIETGLWKAAHSEGSEKENREAYEALHAELLEMIDSGELSDDEDAQALLAYLEAAGEQLGLATQEATDEATQDATAEESAEDKEAAEDSATKDDKDKDKTDAKDKDKDSKPAEEAKEPEIDFSNVEPHVGLPYVIVDDELCTVLFTGYHMSSDHPVAEFAMLNKTSDRKLSMDTEDAIANGIEIEDFSGAYVYVGPGEKGTGWGSFFGKEGDDVVTLVKGELEELTCVVTVADTTEWPNEELGTYAFSWKADKSGKNQITIDKKDKKKAIEEEGVFSFTVDAVRGANDDYVDVEYTSGYSGSGNVTFDSKDDWKVNGVDVELLDAGKPFEHGNGWYRHILLKAKKSGSLGNEPVKTVEGTIVVKDADGKEIAQGKIKVP